MAGFEARLNRVAGLDLQLEVVEPDAEVLALLGRLARTTADIEVEMRGYQLEMAGAR